VEPSSHQLEEDERQDAGEGEDDDATDQLDANKLEVPRREQSLRLVGQAEGDDSP